MSHERPTIERVMLYRRGFKDGSATVVKKHEGVPDYERGYKDGMAAMSLSVRSFCVEIGHDPSLDILRESPSEAPEVPIHIEVEALDTYVPPAWLHVGAELQNKENPFDVRLVCSVRCGASKEESTVRVYSEAQRVTSKTTAAIIEEKWEPTGNKVSLTRLPLRA